MVGYKILNKKMENRYGEKLEVGGIYQVEGIVKYGLLGNGYHFSSNICEIFRFFNTNDDDFVVVEVEGFGKIVENDVDYYGYMNLYVAEGIKINRIIERKDYIKMILEMDEFSVEKFLRTFRLSDKEKEIFKIKFASNDKIMKLISYFQDDDKTVYEREYKKYRRNL